MAFSARLLLSTVGMALAIPGCASNGGGNDGGGEESASTGPGAGTDSAATTTGLNTMTSSPGTTTGDASGSGPADGTATTTGSGTSDGGSSGGNTEGSSSDGSVSPPCPYDPVAGDPEMNFVSIASGFTSRVTHVAGDPTQPDRLFVVQQAGLISVLEPGQDTAPDTPILNIADQVINMNEQGLLSIAFHPDYPDDPRFYIYYAAEPDGRSRIAEYFIDPAELTPIDPDSGTTILEVYNGTGIHYGGMIAFDSAGWLMIGLGDGADDMAVYDTHAIHSRFIRIGVEPDGTPDDPIVCGACPEFGPFDYTIPDDNPFVEDPDYAPEIWAEGVRNPWRWYFHPTTGDIYVGDVGNDYWEEVSLVRPGNHYGWPYLEGNHCAAIQNCDTTAAPNQPNDIGVIAPLIEYDHAPACAVIVGPIYNSCEVPAWQGLHFRADFCAPGVSALRFEDETLTDLGVIDASNLAAAGSGTNAWGEVFFTGGMFGDEIFKLVPVR